MQYKTIMADPPWPESGGGKIKRGADRHYPLMKVKEIVGLSPFVRSLVHPEGCHLYLWVTNNHLKAGLEVLEAWGFRYVTMITWAKDRQGLGQYFRGKTEHVLFGVRGQLPYKIEGEKRQQGTTLIEAPRTTHSKKPEEIFTYAERVSYGPRLEMFARTEREGWDVWGNEVESSIPFSDSSLFSFTKEVRA